MKTAAKTFLIVLILLLATSALMASGQVGIYGIVSKVVLEPNDKAPERIQIWGAFTLVDGGAGSGGKTLTPQRGYLYFTLQASDSPAQKAAARKEWADFKAIAGTGQVVAFGRIFYFGAFSDELFSQSGFGGAAKNMLRSESTAPTAPHGYPLNLGLTKLSSTGDLAAIVKQLQQTLTR